MAITAGLCASRNGGGGGTAFSLATTGAQSGDLLLLVIYAASLTTTPDEAGWTLWSADANPYTIQTPNTEWVYYRVLAAAPPATYGWTHGTSNAPTAGLGWVRGADGTTPVDCTAESHVGTGAAITVPAITTVTADTLLFGITGGPNDGTTHVTTSGFPSGATQLYLFNNNLKSAFYHKAQAAAGSTGTQDFSLSASRTHGALLGAVRPVAAPPPEPGPSPTYRSVSYGGPRRVRLA